MISRRCFIAGLSTLITAPAIVRATSLMPVRALPAFNQLVIGDVITISGGDQMFVIRNIARSGIIEVFPTFDSPDGTGIIMPGQGLILQKTDKWKELRT